MRVFLLHFASAVKLQARVLLASNTHAARSRRCPPAPQIQPIAGDINSQARSALVASFPALAVQENTLVMLHAADGRVQPRAPPPRS